MENILDRKFTPHGSYGINHTNHNLEYGYLIVGLMQPSTDKYMSFLKRYYLGLKTKIKMDMELPFSSFTYLISVTENGRLLDS